MAFFSLCKIIYDLSFPGFLQVIPKPVPDVNTRNNESFIHKIKNENFLQELKMIRRNPTRIVLKLDDLQDYEVLRREQECKKQSITPQSLQTMKTKQDIIHERIGYVPQQRQS